MGETVVTDVAKLRFLLLVLLLLVAPHFFHLPSSHTLLFLSFWSWRFLGTIRPSLLPKGQLLPILTLAAAGVVIASCGGAIDLETSTGLFVAGLGLKLMELQSERDLYFAIFLGWFVALTQFLYDQSLLMAAYAFAAVALLTAALVQFNAPGLVSGRALARTLAELLLPALPLMALLFLFFPRPLSGFIHLSLDRRAKTGLADILEPGAVASLATSMDVAFRVDFEGEIPPPEARYFRAQVFWRFDGRRWHPHPAMRQPLPQAWPGVGESYVYHVTVEPHYRRWLFALGFPAAAPEEAYLTREGVLEAYFPVDARRRYRLVSFRAYRFPPLSPFERELALQLPAAPSARVQDLVDRLRPPSGGAEEFARAVLDYFHTQGFRYTLRPGALGAHPVEEFLFSTRAGFCEHYASALAYLMRAAGFPARIVGGYLGGFVNPRGKFLEVYQANAHAWVEIWVEGKGWVRVDPTEAVAPRYVEQVRNLADPLTEAVTAQLLAAPQTEAAPTAVAHGGVARSLRIFWSTLDHRWHVWVLGYDRTAQARLLAALGERWPYGALLLAAVLVPAAGWARRGGETDPLLREYRKFLRQMARRGLTKAPWETPSAFARRATLQCPEAAERIAAVTERFTAARYGRHLTAAPRSQQSGRSHRQERQR
ncbi:protein-glutamine gamma-glutamyltransferase TgpA [Methylothermus subterraneus]